MITIFSMSDVSAWKRCRRSFYYGTICGFDPAGDRNEAMQLGTDFHNYVALAAGADVEVDDESPMATIAAEYLKKRPLPDGIISAEEPFYTLIYKFGGPSISHSVYIRTTLDLIYTRGNAIVGRDYKGLALDTPIPTPDGWTTMGELQPGDEVFGSDGNICTVTAKSDIHHNPCYKITFKDGLEIICDHEHRWPIVWGASGAMKSGVLSTEEVAEKAKRSICRILTTRPLALPEMRLPIDPYVLGVWLGDGTASNGTVTSADEEIFSNIEGAGYFVSEKSSSAGTAVTRTVFGLAPQLRKLNLIGRKHIPPVYLRSSYKQRLALLQGLMDTDGCWHKTRKRAVFTQVSECVALQVRELVLSLGVTCAMFHVSSRGFGKNTMRYDVCFTPGGFNPFRLSRKAVLVPKNYLGSDLRPWLRKYRVQAENRRRVITSIVPVSTVSTQCITVDSKDSTYLCTHGMLPTHNTFSTAPSLDMDLDFQGRIYSCVLQHQYPQNNIEFEWEYVRRELGRELKKTGYTVWSDDERYINVPMIMSSIEMDTTWRELQETVSDMVRSIDEDRLYRQDLKVGPHSCSFCQYNTICKTEYSHGSLSQTDIDMLAVPVDPAARATQKSICIDPRIAPLIETGTPAEIDRAIERYYGKTGLAKVHGAK